MTDITRRSIESDPIDLPLARFSRGGHVDQSFVSAQVFVEQVYRIGSWKGKLPPATSLPIGGARAMTRLVLTHPVIADGTRPSLHLRLFGPTDDPDLETLRAHSVGYLVAGALALGMTGQKIEELAHTLVLAATAIDPESLLLRQHLLRDRPFGPPIPMIPDWLDSFDTFLGRNCFAGVVKAVLELGQWASDRSTSDAKGIQNLSATSVCQGGQITIFGSGFGASQPADTRVYVPVGAGGCREAIVDQWTDTAIVIQLPSDIGAGCVGFVRGSGQFHEPQRVTGELTTCIGAVAEVWTRGFSRVDSPIVSCQPCLPGGQNHIQFGGRPTVSAFRFTPSHVEPSGQPVLSWNISNVNNTQIVGVSGNEPVLALPNPIPPVGSITLAPVGGLVPVVGRYRLTATNACGATSADAEFTMSRTPNLSVTRIEVIQSIQKVDNSVRLVANRRTAVRVFVDSGISDGFDVGVGPNRVSGVKATLLAENLATGGITSCGACWTLNGIAGPTLNRNVLNDSLNFDVPLSACTGNVRFRAIVEISGPLGALPSAFATGSTDVTFTLKPPQELLPFLIADHPSSATSPALTRADFFATLQGPARMQPFPENGFIVHPEISITLGPGKLTTPTALYNLTLRLATMIFLFPSTPVGGVRVGIFPADTGSNWCGWSINNGSFTRSFIVKAGDTDCCVHELGHCFGLDHVNCGGPAGPYDSGLPLTLSDPGLDITTRSLLPTGTAESMTYCFPQWVSAEHWDRVFDRIPI